MLDHFNKFTSAKGRQGEDGMKDIMSELLKGPLKDNLFGGLGRKFGF